MTEDPLTPMATYDEAYGRADDQAHPDEVVTHGPATEDDSGRPPVLPAEFWAARPVLALVRQAARARGAAPDAVLTALLAHIAVRTPPSIGLPPLVGSRGSLNIAVALLGPSGAGKGASMRTAEDLAPPFTDRQGSGPLGTGQGMLEPFWQRRKDEDPVRCRDAWLYVADEGQVLEKLAAGQGSITLETLRAGWSGERLGTATVSASWRVLHPGQYRMCWLLGLQPSIARALLADTAGGTPQRFVFSGVVDPDAPLDRPDDPGSLDWSPPAERGDVRVAPSVEAHLIRRRHEVLTGARSPGTYDSHRDQLQLKVAALLGLLEGRATVTVEDWPLAGMVLDTSDAVREQTLAAHRAAEAAVEAGRNANAANRARAEQYARRQADDDVARVARVIDRALQRKGPMTRAPLRKCLPARDRHLFDPALAHAEALALVEQDDHGEYHATDT